MNKRSAFAGLTIIPLALVVSLAGCAHDPAYFDKHRAECRKLEVESDRTSCMQKVETEEREYERKHNETKIEKDYKRKLEERR